MQQKGDGDDIDVSAIKKKVSKALRKVNNNIMSAANTLPHLLLFILLL